MRQLALAIDLALWLVQGLVMLVFVVPLQRIAQALTWASWRTIRWIYYPIVRLRRRITGRPLWQDSDLMIGISPPASEAARLGIIEISDDEDTH
jgi:hypothetical protein